MSNQSEKGDTQPLPGSSLDDFQAFCESVKALQESGKLQIFLPRSNGVVVVGDLADLRRDACTRMARELTDAEFRELNTELRRLLTVTLRIGIKIDFDFAALMIYRGSTVAKSRQTALVEATEKKIAVVRELLVRPWMDARLKRFGTSTAPCLEDVQHEMVYRADSSAEAPSDTRRLAMRLKIRHNSYSTDNRMSPFDFSGFLDHNLRRADSFELEVDLEDLDLLMLRLSEAKAALLAFSMESTDGSPVQA